jgi:hypothetical protein
MANFTKYPIYVYDEPATYDDFRGGINLNPASETLADNQIRDGVNLEYSHVSLRKRRGAKKKCGLLTPEQFNFIQGVFLFTFRTSYIVLAADGRLWYADYVPEVDLILKPLPIERERGIENLYLDQFIDLKEQNFLKTYDMSHSGYILKDTDGNKQLIFQNKYPIEAAAYNNKLYITTGTRIVVVSTKDDASIELKASCLSPYVPNGVEYQMYGHNIMSPFPHITIKEKAQGGGTAIKNLIPKPIYSFVDENGNPTPKTLTEIEYTPAMVFADNTSAEDYYFKWEEYEDGKWTTVKSFKEAVATGAGYNTTYSLPIEKAEKVRVRCSFTKDFARFQRTGQELEETTGEFEIDTFGDYVPTQLLGNSYGEYTCTSVDKDMFLNTDDSWRILQSCRKILADGNKFIFYDDAWKKGEWYKSIIGNPQYVTNKGGLSFKTTKNEAIIKAVHFKGAIVVFAYNELIGGNVSIVTGNGDDDMGDQYNYSPYIRKVVSSEITCDCADSVQVSENLLFFKFRDTVYALEGSELTNEVVSFYPMNDNLNMRDRTVNIPWREEAQSELTQDYYALIWKEKLKYINGETIIERPAMRLKMYYKLGQEIEGKVFMPWLRDEGSVFNIDKVVYIDGIATHLRNMDLIQFEDEVYTDLEESYPCSIKLKSYDLNYPKLTKFLNGFILFYHRTQSEKISISVKVKNEAGHTLVEETSSASVQDEASATTQNFGKVGSTLIDSIVYRTPYRFPLLQASAEINIKGDGAFVFSSITYDYISTDLPASTPFDHYTKIKRTSTPLRTRKTQFDLRENI